MLTYGFLGMVAGNAKWFAGRGGRFDDWSNANGPDGGLDWSGQFGVKLRDIDADGDHDLLCWQGILLNREGSFFTIRTREMNDDYNDEKAFHIFLDVLGSHFGPWFDQDYELHARDLNGNGFTDLLMLGQRDIILGVARGMADWQFYAFPGQSTCMLNETDSGETIIFCGNPNRDFTQRLERENITWKRISVDVPSENRSARHRYLAFEFRWVDLDQDGKGELVVGYHRQGAYLSVYQGKGEVFKKVCTIDVPNWSAEFPYKQTPCT